MSVLMFKSIKLSKVQKVSHLFSSSLRASFYVNKVKIRGLNAPNKIVSVFDGLPFYDHIYIKSVFKRQDIFF